MSGCNPGGSLSFADSQPSNFCLILSQRRTFQVPISQLTLPTHDVLWAVLRMGFAWLNNAGMCFLIPVGCRMSERPCASCTEAPSLTVHYPRPLGPTSWPQLPSHFINTHWQTCSWYITLSQNHACSSLIKCEVATVYQSSQRAAHRNKSSLDCVALYCWQTTPQERFSLEVSAEPQRVV